MPTWISDGLEVILGVWGIFNDGSGSDHLTGCLLAGGRADIE